METCNRRLTIEKLRSYPGCENLTDEKAVEIIDSLYKLAAILLEFHYFRENQPDDESTYSKDLNQAA